MFGVLGLFLRRGPAPHRSGRHRLHDRCACRGCGGARCRSRASPHPIRPTAKSPIPGDNLALVIEDEKQRATRPCMLRASARHRRARVAGHAIRRLRAGGRHVLDRRRNDPAGRFPPKRARDIGHLPQSGAGRDAGVAGSSAVVRRAKSSSTSTTPIPFSTKSSAESAELSRRGVEVAWDGMEIVL